MTTKSTTYKLVLGPKAQAKAAQFVDWLVMNGMERTMAADKVRVFAEAIAGKKIRLQPEADTGTLLPVVNYYQELYRAKYHENPIMKTYDFWVFKKLVASAGIDRVKRRMYALATTTDKFLSHLGFTPGTLYDRWTALAEIEHAVQRSAGAPSDCRHTPRCQTAKEHSQKFLSDVAGSSSSEPDSPRPITSKPNVRS